MRSGLSLPPALRMPRPLPISGPPRGRARGSITARHSSRPTALSWVCCTTARTVSREELVGGRELAGLLNFHYLATAMHLAFARLGAQGYGAAGLTFIALTELIRHLVVRLLLTSWPSAGHSRPRRHRRPWSPKTRIRTSHRNSACPARWPRDHPSVKLTAL